MVPFGDEVGEFWRWEERLWTRERDVEREERDFG